MRGFLSRMLYGRHGADELARAMSIGALVVYIIGLCFYRLTTVKLIFTLLSYLLAILSIARIFSRNHNARYAENARYLRSRDKLLSRFRGVKTRFSQRREYRFYKCPGCGVTNRVPKGVGKIRITCPKCGNEFSRKS